MVECDKCGHMLPVPVNVVDYSEMMKQLLDTTQRMLDERMVDGQIVRTAFPRSTTLEGS